MEDVELKHINIDKFKKEVYAYYLDIFSEEERKPIELLRICYEKHYSKIIQILYKNKFVGFMILNSIKDNGYAILDYLAILPQYRNKKIGTKALKLLLEQENDTKGIFAEVEKVGLGKDIEENLLREKRKNFYERLGFKKLNFDLLLFEVVYTPYIFSNMAYNEDIIINEITDIYEAISGKERIKQNCKIIRKLNK